MGMPKKLTEQEIAERLKTLPGWEYRDGRLQKTYQFRNFVQAFGFMTSCALIAEKMDHHPDWFNSYHRVEVQLVTHSAGGVTEKDLQLAEAMEKVARSFET